MSFKTTVQTRWNGNEVKIQGKKVINKSIYETGLVVEGRAKLLAAVQYGYMAASITTQSSTDGTELESPSKYADEVKPAGHDVASFRKIDKPSSEMEVLVGTPVDYAPHVEFGTIRSMAQPFLRPALDLAQGLVLNIVKVASKFYFKGYLLKYNEYLISRGKTPTIGGNL